MRIISLNTWGGRAGKEKLLRFFKNHADTTDVFCLQEMWSHAYKDLGDRQAGGVTLDYSKILTDGVQRTSQLLSDFNSYFRPHVADNYGLLMFVKKTYEVLEEGEEFVYKERNWTSDADAGNHARNIQHVTVQLNGRILTVHNFHGLWNGKGKTDSEDRLQQSKNIIQSISKHSGEHVIMGDFNLLPDTQSIKLLEEAGLRNLIKEYKITSTRTSFYTKPEKFADYTFVSAGVSVKDFKVLSDEVSDHAPMLTEVE